MTDHVRIYLQPECCADDDVGRLWCQDSDPQSCPEGVPWTPYILKSEYDALKAENDRLRDAAITDDQDRRMMLDRIAELETALRESQDWNWITAREEAEDAGRDTFEIPEMQALADLAEQSHTVQNNQANPQATGHTHG